MAKVVLVGYSGHGFVTLDILLLHQHNVIGYFEKSEKKFNPYNISFLGNENDETIVNAYARDQNQYCLGLGDNLIRSRVDSFLSKAPWKAISLIHKNAIISSGVKMGEGGFVGAGSVINPLSEMGRGCIVNTGAIVEHECKLADYVHIAPGAVLAGNVSIGTRSFVGANSVVKQGVKIGANVIIGAGAVVLQNVPDNQTWVGNPARCIS